MKLYRRTDGISPKIQVTRSVNRAGAGHLRVSDPRKKAWVARAWQHMLVERSKRFYPHLLELFKTDFIEGDGRYDLEPVWDISATLLRLLKKFLPAPSELPPQAMAASQAVTLDLIDSIPQFSSDLGYPPSFVITQLSRTFHPEMIAIVLHCFIRARQELNQEIENWAQEYLAHTLEKLKQETDFRDPETRTRILRVGQIGEKGVEEMRAQGLIFYRSNRDPNLIVVMK